MTEGSDLRKVAFLDTNTLHYIGIYLEYAKKKDLFPWSSKDAVSEKDVAKGNVNNLAGDDLKRSLKRGLETINFLLTQDIQVQYTPISELELLTGRTKGQAIMIAAKEGVPDRMWSRLREEEFRDRVGSADLADIKDRIDGLASMLEESGVAAKTSRSDQASESLELAKGINGLVYMEVMDSIIYASAIVAQAEYLLTADEYLRKTVNYIYCPCGNPRYEEISRKLQQLVSQIILGNADDIQLPSAHKVTDKGSLSGLACSRSL